MKRYGNLWSKVCERSNVEQAAELAVKGKRLTKARRLFLQDRQHCIDEIRKSLQDETYCFHPLHSFTVFEPKERNIHCSQFYPDKILHHCVMNVIKPLIMEKLTADTYGSIKGRGVTLAATKLQQVLYEHPDWYFLQIDAKHFYQSIDHDVCKEAVRRVIKCPKTLRMVDAIIDTHDEGLAIGVYPSQYLANLVLSKVDHWAKEVLRTPFYFRYMDDIILVVPDKASAHKALDGLREQFTLLKLTIKENYRIAPVEYGIDFIGYKFYPTHTAFRKRLKVNMQRKVRKLEKAQVSDEEFKRFTASYFGWCSHADCRNLLRKTFGDRIVLYEKNMEFKRLKDIREAENWFGLGKDKRVSIKSLFDVDIVFFEHLITTIKGETKVVVKFAYPDKPEDYHYFITRSDVIRDRLERDKDVMPFIATIKQVGNYTAYE
ncbi:MAG: RNA-directed DNA polymerase [Paludibacteraceae bacterium]|nr:RNA-directed DNA polymerase [Paludibacteraceae bacterium]